MIKGFTLVELVIVIVIVGILSIVAVPIYRSYFRKSMATEGKALLGVIQMSEKAYFAENAAFRGITSETPFDNTLDVDARSNKYFTTFSIKVSGSGSTAKFTAITNGNAGASGMALTMIAYPNNVPTFKETGINN